MKNRNIILGSIMSFILLFCGDVIYSQDTCLVQITNPNMNGKSVGRGTLIKGNAFIPEGCHLWVLARRSDYEGVWWPQGEGKIDPKNHNWKVSVTFGEPQDIGYDFDVSVIVVNEENHILLHNKYFDDMKKGVWTPIQSPPTECPPIIRTVRKINNN